MKRTLMYLAVALLFVFTVSGSARADYSFSSSNPYLASAGETWSFNYDGGSTGASGDNNWGSPGVGAGVVDYGESIPAVGFEITFSGGGTIDPAEITTGDTVGCWTGASLGGTIFCGATGGAPQWTADLVGPDTIAFWAPAGTSLSSGEDYFVNIFFTGATPTGFQGEWITPEPGTLTLLGSGLLGLIGFARRRRS